MVAGANRYFAYILLSILHRTLVFWVKFKKEERLNFEAHQGSMFCHNGIAQYKKADIRVVCM